MKFSLTLPMTPGKGFYTFFNRLTVAAVRERQQTRRHRGTLHSVRTRFPDGPPAVDWSAFPKAERWPHVNTGAQRHFERMAFDPEITRLARKALRHVTAQMCGYFTGGPVPAPEPYAMNAGEPSEAIARAAKLLRDYRDRYPWMRVEVAVPRPIDPPNVINLQVTNPSTWTREQILYGSLVLEADGAEGWKVSKIGERADVAITQGPDTPQSRCERLVEKYEESLRLAELAGRTDEVEKYKELLRYFKEWLARNK